jgi:hypothetical protein
MYQNASAVAVCAEENSPAINRQLAARGEAIQE